MNMIFDTSLTRAIAAGCLLLVAGACSRGADSGGPPAGQPDPVEAELPFILPEQPPDSSPPDLRAELDPEWHAPVDVMLVGFRTGLSRVEKTRLVVGVGATELVGGAPLHPISDVDGIYLIRIRSDGTMGPLLGAIRALNASPDVVRASPLLSNL